MQVVLLKVWNIGTYAFICFSPQFIRHIFHFYNKTYEKVIIMSILQVRKLAKTWLRNMPRFTSQYV